MQKRGGIVSSNVSVMSNEFSNNVFNNEGNVLDTRSMGLLDRGHTDGAHTDVLLHSRISLGVLFGANLMCI